MSDLHEEPGHHGSGSDKPLIVALIVLIAIYFLSSIWGLPEKGTKILLGGGHSAPANEVEVIAGQESGLAPAAIQDAHAHDAESHDGESHDAGSHEKALIPPLWTVIPFTLLLLAIAVFPLLPGVEHWWESNLHRFYVAALLGLITLGYYGFFHEGCVEGHWPGHYVAQNADGFNWGLVRAVFENAILNEYIAFIVLLFALFTIAGGIRIEGNLKATPLVNSIFIAIGSALASFIGTTGAAMLLIRPLLETNRERQFKVHTVVFFIFAVCNCGGCLLPIGDPPLFLGYLKGVPFLWTFSLWKEWLFVNMSLVVIYFIWDSFFTYKKETWIDRAEDSIHAGRIKFSGLFPNVLLLLGVILAVALLDPSKPFPGTTWHPWMFLREIVQLLMVLLSISLGSKLVRKANNFNYHAILEVAALFFGIFICMQAPLQILNERGKDIPGMTVESSKPFFWCTGTLSSVLDNAPTYVVFYETGKALTAAENEKRKVSGGEVITTVPEKDGVAVNLLVAVSLGAVFMGAMTYIGNGPNFMVKAIAEKEGVKMPSFFGYMVYSCCILLPLLVIMTFLFI